MRREKFLSLECVKGCGVEAEMDQISSFIVLQANSWAVIPESRTVLVESVLVESSPSTSGSRDFCGTLSFSAAEKGVDAEPAV